MRVMNFTTLVEAGSIQQIFSWDLHVFKKNSFKKVLKSLEEF
jgi:hypothetical protein